MKAATDKLSVLLRAVADPNRREILRLLGKKGQCSIGRATGLCAADVETRIKLAQPTVSHHMRVLMDAGLVEAEKVGTWMWYHRNEAAIKKLHRILGEL
jgi:ArsR family transcriptional regulator, arsenate/arsenite/antimonite-responsive transcriptional repressor